MDHQQLSIKEGCRSTFDLVVGARPAYAAALGSVEEAIWNQDVVDPITLELCRLRIAQLLACDEALSVRTPAAIDAGLVETTVERLSRWPDDEELSPERRRCLAYAEQLLLDAQGVTDDQATEVVAAIGEAGFLVLTYACGIFETTQRARLLIGAHQW